MSSYNSTITVPFEEPQWNSSPAWKLPGWAEPLMVASILIASMIITRRRSFRIFKKSSHQYGLLGSEPNSTRSSDEFAAFEYMLSNEYYEDSLGAAKYLPRHKFCCGLTTLVTPGSSHFSHHLHSRIMQKFPFLVEMFYWIITYAFYRSTALLSQAIFSKTGIWGVAQEHGVAILEFEKLSWFSFFFPIHENEVQQWFMHGHQAFLTVLNRSYALIHIPGTVGFIAWYYYVAPSHATFATVRRTMTLTNLMAFSIFIVFPCMPPRLLPREYGFLDSVGHNNAESVWMTGKYVNSLAAMPSMHFGYALCIGCTLMYHSGILRRLFGVGEQRKSKFWTAYYILLALWYPSWILITIVATANHYYMDAILATFVVIIAFLCNEVFLVLLPLEVLLFRCLRLEKPRPTTGEIKRGTI
ncbi:hypothetical protein K3495_g12833 [Podosphaera aphanis]|nr:hypothetical protein K3495_g12833 [Podosphaera aphanis]